MEKLSNVGNNIVGSEIIKTIENSVQKSVSYVNSLAF